MSSFSNFTYPDPSPGNVFWNFNDNPQLLSPQNLQFSPLENVPNDHIPDIHIPIDPEPVCVKKKKKNVPAKTNTTKSGKPLEKKDPEFAFRKMEPLVAIIFCKTCQDGAQYDGSTLKIDVCKKCRKKYWKL
ncbi:Nuclear receptor domain-containing protein [Caenorhabditis elegans]|uniref:Nuclear receptor domain-containing protein n=1 Tax=Caenorhabditis elegans TaxID=6239 RepID=S6FN43_CAEEL|nr:Nuclear receptor domain-containing protein [Caenorhabditis elegans]CDG24155.1 Nuclear receptor domain-containing protein [Caenorhabditis elegans]|eukprot:NP_001293489.1 Uncharacterized protein CELE_K09F6.13 [Caenorhabditis elegans]